MYLLLVKVIVWMVAVFRMQAVDSDALQAEGLDLDLVDQMKDLSVVGDDDGDDVESGSAAKSDLLAAFDQSAPSTKVCTCSVSYGVINNNNNNNFKRTIHNAQLTEKNQ